MQQLMRSRGFWLLLTGQSVSALGDILYAVATLAYAYAVTGSSLGTASLLILQTVVRLAAGFVTIQVLDRVPHRTLMLLADLVRGAAVVLLGLYGLRHELGMPVLYTVAAVNACAGSFFTPARAAILPSVVSRAQLVRANGLIASSTQVMQVTAWSLGAALVAMVGAPAVILVNGVSFLISALCTLLLPPVEATGPEVLRESPLERLKAGWREVWTNRVVRDVTIMDSLETMAHTLWTSALMLAFTIQVLGADERWWGYQASAYFAGTMLGALFAALFARWLSRRSGWAISVSSGSFALLTVLYAFSGDPRMAVALCVLFGPVYQVRDVVQSSMLQGSLDQRVIGRAFATREIILNSLFGPALAAMSLGADLWGPQAAYLAGAGLYAVVAVFAVASVPIRTYRILAANQPAS